MFRSSRRWLPSVISLTYVPFQQALCTSDQPKEFSNIYKRIGIAAVNPYDDSLKKLNDVARDNCAQT